MYSSCSRVEQFQKEERNVFIHSFIYSVKGPGAFITHHTLCHAFQMQCIAVAIQKTKKYLSKPAFLGIHMLVIIVMCFVCGRRADKGKK